MGKNWRPEGWDNPFEEDEDPLRDMLKTLVTLNMIDPRKAYESGADAMLEALKMQQIKLKDLAQMDKDKWRLYLSPGSYIEGIAVFIPDNPAPEEKE